MVTALRDLAELRREYTAFVHQVLAESAEPERLALDVFNTEVAPGAPAATLVAEVLANPLNSIGALVHAAGPEQGRPAYIVHGVDGEVGWFLRHLRDAKMPRPVYGVVAPGWYGDPTPDTCEQLATSHLAQIRAHQPEGPYTIGGYSGGGYAALEMARQLDRVGSRADLVVMADPIMGDGRERPQPIGPRDVAVFRLVQLRRRRHPVMAPYFDLADRLDFADAVDMAWGDRSPADPVERRFATGLDILHKLLLAGRPADFTPVSAAGLIVLTVAGSMAGNPHYEAAVDALAACFDGGAEIVTVDESHNRLFENDTFQRLLAERLGR